MNKNKIIVALDSNKIRETKNLVKKIKNHVFAIKIGYEFFFNFGIKGYNELKNIYPKIFLDLKLHDIPNTVSNGLSAIEKLAPIFTTIHIAGGDEMQKIAVKKEKTAQNKNPNKIIPIPCGKKGDKEPVNIIELRAIAITIRIIPLINPETIPGIISGFKSFFIITELFNDLFKI